MTSTSFFLGPVCCLCRCAFSERPSLTVGVAAQKNVCDSRNSLVQVMTNCLASSSYPVDMSFLSTTFVGFERRADIVRSIQTSLIRPWIARVVKYTDLQYEYACDVKNASRKLHNVSRYSQKILSPVSCSTSGSVWGGVVQKNFHVVVDEGMMVEKASWSPVFARTNWSTRIPNRMFATTSCHVTDNAVPCHLVHSHNGSGSHSQIIGRFGSSDVAQSVRSSIVFRSLSLYLVHPGLLGWPCCC